MSDFLGVKNGVVVCLDSLNKRIIYEFCSFPSFLVSKIVSNTELKIN